MANQNIAMVRGDTLSFAFEIEGITDELDSAYFTCKKDLNGNAVFQKSLSEGISLVETGENSVSYRVRVAPEDTKNLEIGNYLYDLQIGLNSDVYTILLGSLKILGDVTRG